MRRLLLFALALLLEGCAGPLPRSITQPPPVAVSVRQAQKEVMRDLSREVRWGGEIIEVWNRSDHTDVLVLGRELKRGGEPREEGEVDGRFIARFGGFMDPARFPKGRMLTVSGPLIGVETHPVGDYPYRYPVVQVTAWHLWPQSEPRSYYHDPWWPYYPGCLWRYPCWW